MSNGNRLRRRTLLGLGALAATGAVVGAGNAWADADAPGIDVSRWQGTIDWAQVASAGKRFAICKATDGNDHVDPTFAANYAGARAAGLYVGGYHFARPDKSDGRSQADYFLDNAGFDFDGKTLPPALDLENREGVDMCYDRPGGPLIAWVRAFVDRIAERTGRDAIIYTRTSWWNPCGLGDFFGANPLWIARYAGDPGELPPGWSSWTMWQQSNTGSVPGIDGDVDLDVVAGGEATLRALAGGADDENPPDMFVISAPERGVAVVGPGYYRSLKDDEEVHAATALIGENNVREGNARQFDLWKTIVLDGTISSH